MEANQQRIFEHTRPQFIRCWHDVAYNSDALVACLYEYWLCYNTPRFAKRLHYIPLPMEIPHESSANIKGQGRTIKVLVGIQPKRDYLKGAKRIASFVESVALRHPGKIEIKYVEGVPYDEYMHMLDEADVLVDQLYSYTPSMNSLAAMARKCSYEAVQCRCRTLSEDWRICSTALADRLACPNAYCGAGRCRVVSRASRCRRTSE